MVDQYTDINLIKFLGLVARYSAFYYEILRSTLELVTTYHD